MVEVWAALTSVVAGVCAGLIGMALTRVPGGRVRAPLYGLIAAGVLWLVGDLISRCATGGTFGREIGVAVLHTGVITLPTLRFLVSLVWARQVDPDFPLRGRIWSHAPLLWSAVLWLAMLTHPTQPVLWSTRAGGEVIHGPHWFAIALPACLLILAALGVEILVSRRMPHGDVRRQAAHLIAASCVTLVAGFAYASGLLPVDPTPTVLAVSGALITFGIAREGLFGVLPAALPEIANEHPDGLVITGADGRMRFANARARELLDPIGLRQDVPFAALLRDARLHPETPLDLERASEQSWWNALAGLHGVPFRLDGDRPRRLHMNASALRGRRGRIRGYWLRISERIDEPEKRLKIA